MDLILEAEVLKVKNIFYSKKKTTNITAQGRRYKNVVPWSIDIC